MHRHELVGRHGVVGVEHALGEVAHDRFGCQVKVAEHLIRAPSAEEPDDVCVDFGDQEGHGATGSEGAGRNLVRGEAEAIAKEAHSLPKEVGDDCWRDALGGA